MFSTYKEAMDWVAAGIAANGKNKFTSSEEYKSAYSEIQALYKKENPVRKKRVRVEIPIFGSSLIMAIKDGRA